MGVHKILVTDDVHPLLIEGFERAGYVCDYQPNISNDEVLSVISGYEGLIINSKVLVDRKLLDAGVQLRFVGRLGSGMEIVDKVYAAERGVGVFSSPEGNCNAVAEHALGMMLALANNLIRADAEVRRKVWRREANRGFELRGKTIGIIGFGHTGKAFARKLEGMEMTILVYDKYAAPSPEWEGKVLTVSPEYIQANADIISFHLPLTTETKHLVNSDFIGSCQEGVIFVNTSRGQVVDTGAVVDGLELGKVGGACLDVFENEKPATFTKRESGLYKRLYRLPNVLLSPHIAGWTVESKRLLSEILLQKILNGNKK